MKETAYAHDDSIQSLSFISVSAIATGLWLVSNPSFKFYLNYSKSFLI